MQRRQFLISTATAIGAQMLVGNIRGQGKAVAEKTDRTYHILGVPLRAGSLLPGNENDAEAYRDVQLLERLQAAGCKAVDDGDVAIPSYLPHHSTSTHQKLAGTPHRLGLHQRSHRSASETAGTNSSADRMRLQRRGGNCAGLGTGLRG